ncbi:hypothetical protein C8J57DRAFT_1477745 [Mycena rebaudengoi]|nr:hypothetical protein C8J57DRAFT_1477745 [Mycena rebaudengoi]
MFVSTGQNLLLATVLALNVASTLGVPIPTRSNSVPGGHSDAADARHPDRSRENALKALRHVESREAALAEVRHGISRRHPLAYSASNIRALDEYDDELERREPESFQNIGRWHPLPYAVGRDKLEDRYLDYQFETRHVHGDMCPCANGPPVPKNPCPEYGNTGILTLGDGTTLLLGKLGSGTGPNEGGPSGSNPPLENGNGDNQDPEDPAPSASASDMFSNASSTDSASAESPTSTDPEQESPTDSTDDSSEYKRRNLRRLFARSNPVPRNFRRQWGGGYGGYGGYGGGGYG